MDEEISKLQKLIADAAFDLTSRNQKDRSAASRKLRQASDLALTLAIALAPKH